MNKQGSGFRGQGLGRRTSAWQVRRGFTLLLAVLVSSILVSLGASIFNILSKEILLSSSGRESQFAFFAADTGIECGIYWDIRQNAFSTTSALTQVACGGGIADLTRTSGGTVLRPTLRTAFSFLLEGNISNPCVTVTVDKTFNPTETVVASRGYNTCVTTSPLRLERAIRVKY